MATLAETAGIEHLSFVGLPMPATIRLAEPISDAELIAFSRRNRSYRIERHANGELEIMSPVGYDGGEREQFVGGELYVWAKEHGGHTFSSNTGFTLADSSVRSPDASWVSDSQVIGLTAAEKRRFAEVCPEFLVEILSEFDSHSKLEAKMEMWIANGAQLAWMIDPFTAQVYVYRPGQSVQVLSRPDFVEAETVVSGFRLAMSRLWAKE